MKNRVAEMVAKRNNEVMAKLDNFMKGKDEGLVLFVDAIKKASNWHRSIEVNIQNGKRNNDSFTPYLGCTMQNAVCRFFFDDGDSSPMIGIHDGNYKYSVSTLVLALADMEIIKHEKLEYPDCELYRFSFLLKSNGVDYNMDIRFRK